MLGILKALTDLVLPPICPVCKDRVAGGGKVVCRWCEGGFIPIAGAKCTHCGVPFPSYDSARGDSVTGGEGEVKPGDGPNEMADHTCGGCLDSPPAFIKARSAVQYSGEAAEAVKKLKFNGRMSLAPLLGRLAADAAARMIDGEGELIAEDLAIGMVVPVPLHVRRLRERGFNQSQLIARAVAVRIGAALETGVLKRVRETRPQVSLKGSERVANVKGAFVVPSPEKVKGKKVLIVDDVITTGATVRECAKVLGKAGAETWVLSLARASSL